VAQIDVDPDRAGRNYPGSTPLVGDARTVLAQLREAARAEPAAEVRAAVARCREAAASALTPAAGDDRLDPAAVFRTLNQVAGGVTVVGDCGTPTPHLASSWELEESGRRLLLARGHGPMGYALPGAVGAALATPGEAVLAIVTDGSLLMAAGALECAARERLPIVYVHLSNGTLGWIKTLQHLYLERRYFSTDLSRFDAGGGAAALGVESYRITSLDELATRVREGLDGGRPRFLDVPIPSEEEALPPVAPWRRAAEGAKERPVY
jgi:acetolactate synthase-1/2/3 large subunit